MVGVVAVDFVVDVFVCVVVVEIGCVAAIVVFGSVDMVVGVVVVVNRGIAFLVEI